MKKLKIILIALCLPLLPLVYTGCGTTGSLLTTSVTPQASVVVNAEKTLRVSKDTFDLFLKLEYQNQALVKAKWPQIHQFAEYIRRNAPTWLITANNAKNDYKHGRGNLQSLMAAIDTLTSNQTQAQTYITQLQVH